MGKLRDTFGWSLYLLCERGTGCVHSETRRRVGEGMELVVAFLVDLMKAFDKISNDSVTRTSVHEVVHSSGDRSYEVQQSDDPSQASGDRLHFPGSTRNSQVTEPEASRFGKLLLDAKKMHRRHLDATSPRIPMPRNRETDSNQKKVMT